MNSTTTTPRRLRALAVVASLLAASLASGCANDGPRVYHNNDLQLLTSYSAQEMCSCIFVMHQTDAFCRAWTRQSPDLRTLTVDRTAQTVDAQSVTLFSARARYTGGHFGCVLE